MGQYFVILNDQHGGALAMTGDDEGYQLALFDSYEEAYAAGENNLMGKACGFEIHQREVCHVYVE